MPDAAGMPDPETNDIVLPPALNLSSERVVPYGLYLIDDGQTQFIWLGRDAVPALINDVFGVEDKNHVVQGKTTLPELDNDFNERIRAVLEKSRDTKAKGVGSIVVPTLYVVREDGEPSLKLWAQTMLVEDRTEGGPALQQWLGTLSEKVREAPGAMAGVTAWFD
jgi:protein transport protein SEC24